MDGILNEHTRTVHKQEPGATGLHTACGVTYNLDPEKLRTVSVERAAAELDASRCGRCFEDWGGY